MPDSFDVHTPSPDDGHEAIRVAVIQYIEDLGYNTEDVGLSLSLVDTLFLLLDEAMSQAATMQEQIDAVDTRVAALEPALFTEDEDGNTL